MPLAVSNELRNTWNGMGTVGHWVALALLILVVVGIIVALLKA